MKLPVFIIDAFTNNAFCGNPASVVITHIPLDDSQRQKIAMELCQPETAFVDIAYEKQAEKESVFNIRWFSPLKEVALCGHATLAAAYALFNEYANKNSEITFKSKSGNLVIKNLGTNLAMDFPADEYTYASVSQNFINALGLEQYMEALVGVNTKKLIIRIDNSLSINEIEPDFSSLLKLSGNQYVNGVGITQMGNKEFDFISRYFNPWFGVNEDSVTGSVHTVLAPYWAKKLNKTDFHALQSSKRSGILNLSLLNNRVIFQGNCTLVLKGELSI